MLAKTWKIKCFELYQWSKNYEIMIASNKKEAVIIDPSTLKQTPLNNKKGFRNVFPETGRFEDT